MKQALYLWKLLLFIAVSIAVLILTTRVINNSNSYIDSNTDTKRESLRDSNRVANLNRRANSGTNSGTSTYRNLLGQKFADLESAKVSTKKVLSLIRARYELDGPIGSEFFLTANNINRESWEMIKIKLAHKIVTHNSTFLMIFGGSSVTAGHDNYFNQSYPMIFKKRLSSVFEALGIELIVRNIAQGANNCSPYILCYESMGGLDPDFLNWEQSYNCGRDEAIFETLARVAGWSETNRAIVYYSASGAWSPSKCPNSVDPVPYSDEEWTPSIAGLQEWDPSINDIEKEKDLLVQYSDAAPSSKRFTGWRGDYHDSIAYHGFNVWENNPKCKFKKDGKDSTGCNGIDAAQECTLKFMTHEAGLYGSDNQKGANWHPTRAFHMLRGEAIAWIYSLILMESIFIVEEGLEEGKTFEEMEKDFSTSLKEFHRPLPHAKRCSGPYHCHKRAVCHTDYKPHYPKNMTLSEIIVGENEWKYEAEIYQQWALHYGFLDAKPIYSANEPGKSISVLVTVGEMGVVWLCGGSVKESLKHVRFKFARDVSINTTDAESVKSFVPDHMVAWEKHSDAGNECISLKELPVGTHLITITSSEHKSALSHVILWP